MLMWEEQRRQMVTEKGALHATIVDMRREWEDTKSKLNTLAADNIMLREVMTDVCAGRATYRMHTYMCAHTYAHTHAHAHTHTHAHAHAHAHTCTP